MPQALREPAPLALPLAAPVTSNLAAPSQEPSLAPLLIFAVPLTSLRTGDWGVLDACDLQESDRELLRALGLADHARFRLCKAGSPWIIQVQGTRIGIADAVACKILVRPETAR